MSAEQALKAHRRSQRLSSATGIDPRKFTLNRNAAKEIRDAQVALALSEWLSTETGMTVRGQTPLEFCADLEDGVVLCKLASKFGQITRFRDPPKNEFQRLENFELFSKSMQGLGLSSAPPSSKRDAPLSTYVPCLLEMAILAKKHAGALEMESSVPEEVIDRAEHPMQDDDEESLVTPINPPAKIETPRKDVVIVNNLDEEDDDPNTNGMNEMLGQLHIERMKRQRAGPPKLRLLDVGGRQLVAIERPGESIGSIIWQGSIDLVNFLHKSVGKSIFSNENKGSVLELGSGCGLCGVWAACEGSDVVVTDVAPSIDLLWANVAANAQQVVKSGGSCSARALDFSDGPFAEKLVRSLSTDAPLTVIAADIVYGDVIRPLLTTLGRIFTARPDTKMYLAYKVRDPLQEEKFFESVVFSEVGAGSQPSNGDTPCKIFLITGLK